ncbi:MAG: hypothetical protein IJX92_03570 [Clostridia bacterium]|nr:hypothetical protein [Clostridia bacterium]
MLYSEAENAHRLQADDFSLAGGEYEEYNIDVEIGRAANCKKLNFLIHFSNFRPLNFCVFQAKSTKNVMFGFHFVAF